MSDLIYKIVEKIIEVGQSDTTKFRLGETIRYSPSEILEILKQHESEIFSEEKTINDLISRQTAIDDIETVNPSMPLNVNWVKNWIKTLPPAQPELIEQGAYVRGFEQGKTQGMIDSQGGKNMIKAEWTNADTLDLQQTCNQLATDCISRQAAIDTIRRIKANYCETADDQILLIDKAMAMTELMILPSVQPEIIRCGECKHHEGETYCHERDGLWYENDYCRYAERKEQDDG